MKKMKFFLVIVLFAFFAFMSGFNLAHKNVPMVIFDVFPALVLGVIIWRHDK